MKNKKDFQVSWAKTVNDPEFKPYKDKYGTKHQVLWGVDYAIYNIVRNLPIERGFVKGSKKLENILNMINYTLKHGEGKRIKFLFEDTVNFDEFKEKANEAVRIYRSA